MILNLTVKKHWFDLIVAGVKTVEYRDEETWKARLLSKGMYKSFKFVHFVNGYGKDSPSLDVECLGIKRLPCVHFDEPYQLHIEHPVFAIELGERVALEMYEPSNATEGEWFMHKFCDNCHYYSKSGRCQKDLITLSMLGDSKWIYFKDNPVCPYFVLKGEMKRKTDYRKARKQLCLF